ncbi:hypothetical protein DYB25_003830 [Aphanomyces astaci]|uniref:MSP domain-containing protein n=1 Tax=Aphanomyces astaci TaxID=112090 RepID=A0A397C8B6_APHAT|nr:hypothetical protein DYB25_003830 [Aphanomyces astaci]RHY04492.1 hypothetical protein DYB36_007106 [Aphanomyces astaci]RHY41244.1 hypothetical protein DYB30_001387 [Aphanomyces astaci]RHY47400.1 hypothetical protein DYB38_010423 [Aphanomyces astaci]RHY78358.1 hypothetical protein DYB34_003454 [Aphanomyces astaci]
MTAECVTIDDLLLQEDVFSLTQDDLDAVSRRYANQSGLSSEGSRPSSTWTHMPRSSVASSTWTTGSHPSVIGGKSTNQPSMQQQGVRMSCESSTNSAWTLTEDSSWLNPPACVSILPSSDFTLDGNVLGDKHTITLYNTSPSRHIVYKLKVPNKCRSWYAITPNQGILRPNESLPIVVEVAVTSSSSQLLETVPMHSSRTIVHAFRLDMIFVVDSIVDQLEYLDYGEQHRVQTALWDKALPSCIQQTMLHCHLQCTRLACLDADVLHKHHAKHDSTKKQLSCLTRRHAHGASLVLTNSQPTTTVAFKIKSNCGLTATPSFGLIEPYGTIAVHVTPKRHTTNKLDLLRIETMPLVDVDTHVKSDPTRTLDDIRRLVQVAWSTIDAQYKTTQTMFPWEGDRRGAA